MFVYYLDNANNMFAISRVTGDMNLELSKFPIA